MKKNITGLLVIFLSLSLFAPFAYGQSSDWNAVIALKDKEIAVKTANGKTIFGNLTAVDADSVTVQVAAKKTLTGQSVTFQKSEVKKVWTAKLKLGKGLSSGASTAIGAGAGAGAGLGIGMILLGATGGSDSGGAIVGGLIAIGAGAGAALGYFAGRGGHQKVGLVYQVK